MEPVCRNRGICLGNRSLRTLLLIACLGLWIQQTSGADVITATVGQTVTLLAPVTGRISSYTWYRGTTAVGDPSILTYFGPSGPQITGAQYTGRETGLSDGSLEIRDVLANYTGNYTRNLLLVGASPVTLTMDLRVYEPVSIPVIDPVPENPIENGSLTLSCNASGTAVSYEWYRAGTLVVSEGRISLTHNNQTLTLSPCKKSDTGTSFTCRAFNTVSNFSSTPYNVIISYGPDSPVISVNPEKEFYAEGSPLTLSCKAESYPPALYTWLHKGKSIVGQNITFNSLTLSDSGNYTCNSTNNVTHLSNYATWEIRVLEKVSKPILKINVSEPIENQPVALTCENSNSATTILWFFNNKPLQPDNNRLTLSADKRTLTISRISRSDAGSYQCEAENPVSHNTSDPLTVTVSYGPDKLLITPSQNVEIKLGNELSLTCTADSYPAAQYQWWHNNTNINKTQSTYTKSSSTYDDSGTYTCVASNSRTGLSANVSVIIKISESGPPSPGIGGGAIAGIVIAVVVVLIVIGVIIWYFCFKQSASGAQKGDQTEMNGAPAASNLNAAASGKANGPAEDVQYTTVKFEPKTNKATAAAAPEGTVYSEVRRK